MSAPLIGAAPPQEDVQGNGGLPSRKNTSVQQQQMLLYEQLLQQQQQRTRHSPVGSLACCHDGGCNAAHAVAVA